MNDYERRNLKITPKLGESSMAFSDAVCVLLGSFRFNRYV
jgi:hypothetical protein